MKDRAGFFAGCADTLTYMSIYYVVAGILIYSQRGWGLHLVWLLLAAAVCSLVYALVLQRPRSVAFLTVFTGVVFAAVWGLYVLVSTTPPKFGYLFLLAVGAGMTVGLPLYYGLNRPLIQKHLTVLDILILALLGLLLCQEALNIDGGTVALMVIVLLLDAASAVGLRMTEGGIGDGRSAIRATGVALCASLVVFLVIFLFTALFSRSGALTGGILQVIASFFASIGSGIERFFRWISGLVAVEESYETVPLAGELPSTAAITGAEGGMNLSVNTTALGIGLCLCVIAVLVVLVLVAGKKKLSRETKATQPVSTAVVHRSGGTFALLWQMLKKALHFRWTAFVQRDTPAGLLVRLERLARRHHTPRQPGESMGDFIRRMDKTGGLDTLAEALNRQVYGGGDSGLTSQDCRALRTYMRKVMNHG
jgi:hypothetical protein